MREEAGPAGTRHRAPASRFGLDRQQDTQAHHDQHDAGRDEQGWAPGEVGQQRPGGRPGAPAYRRHTRAAVMYQDPERLPRG